MAAGLTPTQVMLSFMGKEGDPYSNGRQFPLQGADLATTSFRFPTWWRRG